MRNSRYLQRTVPVSSITLILYLLSTPLPAAELFGPASVSIRVGELPRAIAIADYDGDGTLDMAVANQGGDSVSILLGDGLGSFTPTSDDIPVGDAPRGIVAGDFDIDGAIDLAVSNSGSDSISILLGDGKGGFERVPGNIPVGAYPLAMAADDYNADGALDLAVGNRYDDSVSVLLGDGAGGFSRTAADTVVGDGPFSLAVGDFDGDGNSDLATANFEFGSTTVSILIGDGLGGFVRNPEDVVAGNRPSSIAVGDFDRDGDVDLGVAAMTDDAVAILMGDGVGGFTPSPDKVPVGGFPYCIVAGDFNGDGAIDLATSNFSGDSVSILLNDGSGGFGRSPDIAVGNEPRTIAVGDFNRDGGADLAVGNLQDDSISILLGDGIGNFVRIPETAAGTFPRAIVTGHFNDDPNVDLAVAAYGDDFVRVLLGDGERSFTPLPPVAVGQGPQAIAAADFDGDGDEDLAVANMEDDTLDVLRGDGAGGFDRILTAGVGPGPRSVAVEDFNNDGADDIITANRSDGLLESTLSLLINDRQGGFEPAVDIRAGSAATDPRFVIAEDFNGDANVDLAVSREGADDVAVLLGNGAGSFDLFADIAVGDGPASMATGDFDDDGNVDLAVANFGNSSTTVSILIGNGLGSFSRNPQDVVAGRRPSSVVASDFNADGFIDLAVSSFTDRYLSLFLGDGTGGFRRAAEDIAVGPYPYAIAVADLDNDGTPDMAVAQESPVEEFNDSAGLLFNRLPERADVNGSNRIDGFDIAAVGRLFGADASDDRYRRGPDVNLDGVVDGDDLNLVAGRFGGLNRLTSPLRPAMESPPPADPGTVTVQPVASEGDVITLQLLVNDNGFSPAAAADFILTYHPVDADQDPTQVLEALRSHEPGSYLAEGATPIYMIDGSRPGEVRVRIVRLPNVNRSGEGVYPLLSLFFRARRAGRAIFEFAPSEGNARPVLLNDAGEEVAEVAFVGGAAVDVVSAVEEFPGQRIGFAPQLLDFAFVEPGGAAMKNLVVSNFGFSELEVAAVQPNLAEFSVQTAGFTVPPFAFVEMPVLFSPATPGLFSGHLTIASDDPVLPVARVPLLGRSGLSVGLSPARMEFGPVAPGGSRTLRVRLTNREDSALVMTSMMSSDAVFEALAGFDILDPGETGSIDVTFRPVVAGDYAGLLTLGFNAPVEKRVVVSLTGYGE